MTGERVKIVVWDSIGNTLLGVRPWSSWDAPVRETLLRENPSAESIAVPLREILADYDVDLTWFNSADAPYAPFGQLYADYEGSLRFTRSIDEIVRAIEDADFLVLHKERLPAEALERAKNLRLVQHLGQDFRGVPLDAARARGIPVAATPLSTTSPSRSRCGPTSSTGPSACLRCGGTWPAGPTSIPGTASRTPSTSAI